MIRQPLHRLVPVLYLIFHPVSAMATQTHGGLEGLYVHQLAHLFFAFAMALLIFWLRKWRLTVSVSWRHIQYAALFLIAWNLDTVASHWLLEQSGLVEVENIPPMRIRIVTAPGWEWLSKVYYLSKLDHLLCVPALVFLFLGLKRLLNTAVPSNDSGEPTP